MNWLTILIFLPILSALVVGLLPTGAYLKKINIAVAGLQLVVFSWMAIGFSTDVPTSSEYSEASFQFVERANWFELGLGANNSLDVDYFVAVDGISFSLIGLSIVILIIAAVSSLSIQKNIKGYVVLFLLLNGAIIGCFAALDLFLFYLFFEFMLLPMYFLIGIWGGPRREYASIKFFLYTLLGSILILIVLIALYSSSYVPTGVEGVYSHSLNLIDLSKAANYHVEGLLHAEQSGTLLGLTWRHWAFVLVFIGFGIKLPMFPFHTWLPDAHVEAPTPISVILAGILLKVGGYGLIRMGYMLFPSEANDLAWWVALMGVISIIYGGLNALGSNDLKKLIAYSSVGHMGFVLLGLASATSEGVLGATYQMISHGLISPMLFLVSGVLYDRTHNREINNYSGLASKMKLLTVAAVVAFFASLGLPMFSGFVAELLTLLGSFKSGATNGLLPHWMPVVATFGIVISAAYALWTIQRMFFGPFSVKEQSWSDQLYDLTSREKFMLFSLAGLILFLGVFPSFLIDMLDQSVAQLLILMQN